MSDDLYCCTHQPIITLLAPAEVKETWQALRDRYTKERKLVNKQPPSGSGASSVPTPSWIYKQMYFLDKHIKQRH